MLLDSNQAGLLAHEVSILTGPGGPVLLPANSIIVGGVVVSILTGPGGPVLPVGCCAAPDAPSFQSSPGPEARCYPICPSVFTALNRFNPHRARRPGATYHAYHATLRINEFQSSPGPKARCYRRFLPAHTN